LTLVKKTFLTLVEVIDKQPLASIKLVGEMKCSKVIVKDQISNIAFNVIQIH